MVASTSAFAFPADAPVALGWPLAFGWPCQRQPNIGGVPLAAR